MEDICYHVVKGVHDVIAKEVQGWNPYRAATLQGLYEQETGTSLDTSDPKKAASTLVEYRKKLAQRNATSINSRVSNMAETQERLLDTFTAQERHDRISMISTMFSMQLDRIQKANPGHSRKEFCNGYTENGKKKAGQMAIFETVYDLLMQKREKFWHDGDFEKADKVTKTLENWDSLVAMARIRLKETEELKLGQKLEYAEDANANNFGDNDMNIIFDEETSVKDGWMETSDMQSSFGSINSQVRRVIGRTPMYKDNGELDVDDLGFPRMLDPVTTHQTLSDMLRGLGSESDMMARLREQSEHQKFLSPLIKTLENDDTLRTKFYIDLHKSFQPYSTMKEIFVNGVKSFQFFIKNKIDKSLTKSYIARVTLGKQLNPKTSVYGKKGEFNREALRALDEKIRKNLPDAGTSIVVPFWQMSRFEKKQFLIEVTEALGIEMSGRELDKLLSNSRDAHAFVKNLTELSTYAIPKVLDRQELTTFKSVLEYKPASQSSSKEGLMQEKISKMLALINKHGKGLRLEKAVRHKDSKGHNVTRYSDVQPCYMTEFLETIERYVNNNDKEGLRKFLENKFLNSSFFKYEGKILNRWIRDLYDSTFDENSLATNFVFDRFLGTETKNNTEAFENYTSKQHAASIIARYFTPYTSNHENYAYYPVFILGDSGVSKFIKAKRYSYDDILDGMWDVYQQELRRQQLTRAAHNKLENGGYSTIVSYKGKSSLIDKANRFTTLTFLNDDFVAADGTVGKYAAILGNNPDSIAVKKAIAAYMQDAQEQFTKKLKELGLLAQTKDGRYIYFDDAITKNRDINECIKEFFWNTKFATIEQLQLMTVDPAFYLDTKELQKRYKEIHAPGKSLSLEAKWEGQQVSDGIERCVYFDDISLDSSIYNAQFMNAIKDYYQDKEGGEDIINLYKKNTLTDGQGYRTLDSYRKVQIMAGNWTEQQEKYFKEIKRIRAKYGKDKQISKSDYALLSQYSVIFQPIKPYMFTLENFPVNGDDVLKIPVQHKYAEIVIIPELLPMGSKLRDIAYWAEEQGVDMIGSNTIVKTGEFGTCNISNANNAEELNSALNKAYIHKLNYADYRIQNNVPEHINNNSQLFGTQIRKLIMAGVRMDDYHYEDYVGGNKVNLGGNLGMARMNGRNLISFYNSLVVSNILESYNQFADEIGTHAKLSDILTQMTTNNSRESKDNLLAYSLTGDERFLVPLFEGALEHDSSAMLFSIFKKRVNKQTIKGGSAVQASAMGLSGYEKDGSLHTVTNGTNVLWFETEVPFDVTYTGADGKEHSLNYDDWVNEDGTLKLDHDGKPLLEKAYPHSLDLVAYRIPTENDYSMLNLKIVRFSRKEAGGTIKVPPECTTISGFDFDIDKLYFMRYQYTAKQLSPDRIEELWHEFYDTHPGIYAELKIAKGKGIKSFDRLYQYWEQAKLPATYQDAFNKFLEDKGIIQYEQYDYSKPVLENSRSARNNELLNLIQHRLMDKETFGKRTTPGGFAKASKAARVLRELIFGKTDNLEYRGEVNFTEIYRRIDEKEKDPEPNYDPTDPMTLIIYNQQNQVAGKLIGIFANQNTNHAFSSLMKTFVLKKPIEFAGHSYSDLLHAPEGIDVDMNVAEFLSASVDAVKDPVLNFLNLNTITADAGALLARIGYTTEEIGLLFNQPIIKEVCEYSFNNNNLDIDIAIRNVKNGHLEEGEDVFPSSNAAEFSKNQLALNILNYREASDREEDLYKNSAFRENQIHVLDLFSKIMKASKDVSQFVTSTKFTASNAVGSTFGDFYAQQMRVNNYLARFGTDDAAKQLAVKMEVTDNITLPIDNSQRQLYYNDQEYLEFILNNPFAYEQAMYDMNRRVVETLRKYYPYDTKAYSDARSRLAQLTRSNTLDADTINSAHSEMLVYMLAQQEGSLFSGDTPTWQDIPAREYYTKHFPYRLYDTLEENPEYKEMPIFKYMEFSVDSNNNNLSCNISGIGGLQSYLKDEIRESWSDLYKVDPNLARDLFMYCYYKLGFTFSPVTFMNLAPTRLKKELKVGRKYNEETKEWEEQSYLDFLQDVLKGKVSVDNERFVQSYILNHLDNSRFVYTPVQDDLKFVRRLARPSGVALSSFTLDIGKLGNDANSFVINDKEAESEEQTAFRPVIMIDGVAYMAQGNVPGKFNVSTSTSIEYVKVNPLGSTNSSMQYLGASESNVNTTTVGPLKARQSTQNDAEEGNGSTGRDADMPDFPTSNVDYYINKIIEVAILNGNIMQEEAEKLRATLLTSPQEDLIDTLDAITKEAIQKGLLDKTGKKIC